MGGFVLSRLPQDEEELYWTVKALWGVTIPRYKVCPDHCSPMQAFADAYFSRNTINPSLGVSSLALWHGSRGLSGKSYMLAVLGLTKAFLLGSDVNLLGGSLAQSTNIHEHMRNSFDAPNAPRYMIAKEGTTLIKLTNRARIRPLTASQRTVRGPHPATLLLDEIDEMDLAILDAALGQPMPQINYMGTRLKPHTVMCSTWQNAEGTFTQIKQRAEEKGIPVYSWCYKDTSNPIDGWLGRDTIEEKRHSIPAEMWRTEYDLGEPSIGNRAFDTDCVDAAFSLPFEPEFDGEGKQTGGYLSKKEAKDYWEYRFENPERGARFVAGADWGKEEDYTVVYVIRVDCYPRRLAYLLKVNRRPYPLMIGYFNKALNYYRIANRGAYHDGTGLGNVVDGYTDIRARKFQMQGEKRDMMLSEYVNAIEKGAYQLPKIPFLYRKIKHASVGDLYGRGDKHHLPDEICAAGLAEKLAGRIHPVVAPQVLPRSSRPTKAEALFAHPGDVLGADPDIRIVSEAPVSPAAAYNYSFVV